MNFIISKSRSLALLFGYSLIGFGYLTFEKVRDLPWISNGLPRFLALLAATTLVSLVILGVKKSIQKPLLLSLTALLQIAIFGWVASASVVLMLLVSTCIGVALTATEDPSQAFDRGQVPLAATTGLAALSLLQNILLHFPINTPVFYLVLFTGILLHQRKRLYKSLAKFWIWIVDGEPISRDLASLVPPVAILLLYHFVVGLPEVSHDGLAVHLFVPSTIGARAQWLFETSLYIWATLPMGADWLYSTAYMLGGEFSVKLLNFSALALIIWLMIEFILKRTNSARAASFAILFLLTIPITVTVTASLFVENILALFILGAVVLATRLIDTWNRSDLLALLVVSVATASVKVGGLLFAIPSFALSLILILKNRNTLSKMATWKLIIAASAIISAGYLPYIFATLTTGNPVFPYLNGVFASPLYEESNFFHERWTRGIHLFDTFLMTFNSERYIEGSSGSLGFSFLALLPIALVPARSWSKKGFALTIGFIATYWVGVSLSTLYIRYLYPVFPLIIVLSVLSLAEYLRNASIRLTRVLHFALTSLILLNLLYLPSAAWHLRSFNILSSFTPSLRRTFVRHHAPQRILINQLNSISGDQYEVAVFGTPVGYGANGDVHFANWYNPDFRSALALAENASAIGQTFYEAGISYVIVEASSLEGFPLVRPYLQEEADLIGRSHTSELLQLHSDITFQEEVLDKNSWEVSFREWESSSSEVEITTDGILLPPGEHILQIVTGLSGHGSVLFGVDYSCSSTNGVFRLQIGWTSENGRFIGTDAAVQDCSMVSTRSFEQIFVVPKGADRAVPRVVNMGPNQIHIEEATLRGNASFGTD